MSFKLKEGRDNLTPILDRLTDPTASRAKVGIQGDEDSELLTYANANEFGANLWNGAVIPARPFIRQTFDKYKSELLELGREIFAQVRDGKITKKQGLFLWGQRLEEYIQKEINAGDNFEANADSTIRQKGDGLHPLQWSGRLQNSIKTVTE